MTTRGQTAIEFMFFVAISLVILTASFIFSSNMNADTIALGRKFEAENVCKHFSVLISSAATSGNGTVIEYLLPPQIGGSNYSVILNSSSVSITVDYLKGSQTCLIPTANFTTLVVANKTGFIKNMGKGVVIE